MKLAGFTQVFAEARGGDEDFGAASPTLLPGGNVLGGGKDGHFYLFDPNKIDLHKNSQPLQQIFLASSDRYSDPAKTHHIHGSPIFYEGAQNVFVYVWGENDVLRCFRYDRVDGCFPGQPNCRGQPAIPVAVGSTFASADAPIVLEEQRLGGMPGAMLSLSADGSKEKTAIVWASFLPYGDANWNVVDGELRAFQADEFEQGRLVSLWSSRCNRGRDDFGKFAKFCCPTVAGGRVFQATFNNPGALAVYGKLSTSASGGYNIGFGKTTGLVFNGSASIEDGHVRLVEAPHVYQAGSVFYRDRVNVEAFRTMFLIRLRQSDADGFTFTVQGASPHALGGSGMGLGYGPYAGSRFDRGTKILSSVALKFGLIDYVTSNARSSIGLYLDGATPSGGPTERELAVDLHKSGVLRVTVEYANGILKTSIVDTRKRVREDLVFDVDLPIHTGKEAYVGFTGASGSKTSTQDLLRWDFTSDHADKVT